jgi:hypothetical protein
LAVTVSGAEDRAKGSQPKRNVYVLRYLEGAYEQVSHRLNSIEQRLAAIEQKIDKQFLWLVGLILVSIALPLAGRFLPR